MTKVYNENALIQIASPVLVLLFDVLSALINLGDLAGHGLFKLSNIDYVFKET